MKLSDIKKILQRNQVQEKKEIKLHQNHQRDFTKEHRQIINFVKSYTMTSEERIFSLIEAIKYLEKHKIEGDIVECGVWRGGSMMAAAMTLTNLDNTNRHLYLYDTFDGMTPPQEVDKKYDGNTASKLLKTRVKSKDDWLWAFASLEDVKENFSKLTFDFNRLHFIKGKVEETLPKIKPERIALLRLDTDWYASTKAELEHLYPLISSKGILIIDDYGHWQGCKKAVDEFFADKPVFLNRVDYTCRLIVKP